MPIARTRRRITGWDVSVVLVANAVVIVGLWWRQGGLSEVHDLAGLLTSLGRLTGLLGAFLALGCSTRSGSSGWRAGTA